MSMINVRSGDNNLGVYELLVELGVFALLVGSGHQRVAVVFEPLADAKLVLGTTKKTGLVLSMLARLHLTQARVNTHKIFIEALKCSWSSELLPAPQIGEAKGLGA